MTRGSLGVDWFMPGRKRRFTTTTVASSNLIVFLADEHGGLRGPGPTWAEMVDLIHHDPEAKAVAQHFVDRGYGQWRVRQMVTVP